MEAISLGTREVQSQQQVIRSLHFESRQAGSLVGFSLESEFSGFRAGPAPKSQLGLPRTLLFDIFCQCPQLVGRIGKKQVLGHTAEDGLSDSGWTLPTLRRVLEDIAAESNLPARVCFFIDGLDEYQGDHIDLCRDLVVLGKSPHIKLCVSSRPWNDFEDSFGQGIETKLYMQDVNREDITNYSAARLREHPCWDSVLNWSPETGCLVEEITLRSRGVFLWVFESSNVVRLFHGEASKPIFSDNLAFSVPTAKRGQERPRAVARGGQRLRLRAAVIHIVSLAGASVWNSSIGFWDAKTGTCIRRLEGDGPLLERLESSPDRTQLAWSSGGGTVNIWDAVGDNLLMSLAWNGSSRLCFSPDNKDLLSASRDGGARIWNLNTRELHLPIRGHPRSHEMGAWHQTGTMDTEIVGTRHTDGKDTYHFFMFRPTLPKLRSDLHIVNRVLECQSITLPLENTHRVGTTAGNEDTAHVQVAVARGHAERLLPVAVRCGNAAPDICVCLFEQEFDDTMLRPLENKQLNRHVIIFTRPPAPEATPLFLYHCCAPSLDFDL
ncbi:DNA damage-inducible protein 1 [Emericellopsis cladophorae]|uniref:DNA damage-inducible protein 1 n=1 Tax=Emericellopsis cladophorae TaxID=2686198 RepID=A0A9P9Y9J9_9HYPO|nr:DNA damage-inducible protein 1 [Emericellopsis cladophorae]KAI6785913.1 DNA damage-inducible protein 1 [Emericellopsis cladophorae]